jgi:hypothetical protein
MTYMESPGACLLGCPLRLMRARLIALALTLLWTACGSDGRASVSVGDESDDVVTDGGAKQAMFRCDDIEVQDGFVLEREKDFTARYKIGVRYTKELMIFGGDPIEDANKLSNMYVFALDKEEALRIAVDYPDFFLCSSPGGMEASKHIVPLDLVPANCDVYEQLRTALTLFKKNEAAGGDRTSLRIEGAPLELVAVTANGSGQDVTDQVHDQDFHLVTSVEQLTGESLLDFGTTK